MTTKQKRLWRVGKPTGRFRLRITGEVEPEAWNEYGAPDGEPELYVWGLPGEAEAAEVVFPFVDGWVVRLRFEPRGDEVEMVDLAIRPTADGGVVAAQMMRKIRLGALMTEAEVLLRDPVTAWANLGSAWPGPVKRPGRGGTDDVVYARWAARYVDALEHDRRQPHRWIVDNAPPGEYVTAAQSKAMVNEARTRGLLSAAKKGRAGGEMTDKGRRVLAELGGM